MQCRTTRVPGTDLRAASALTLCGLVLGALACATSAPYQEPFAAERVEIGPGEELAIDRVIVLFDASGSIDPKQVFPGEKAWVEAFVQGMPEGDYQAGLRSFGGDRRRGTPPYPFDRGQLATTARDLRPIGEDSPLDDALLEIADELAGQPGRTAVVVVSDGLPNPPEWGEPDQPALEAARSVVTRSGGPVCFHTVLAGEDPAGAPLLESISLLTPCGTYRASQQVDDTVSLAAFEREVFVSDATPLPPVAAPRPADLDGDGVLDRDDACADTPRGATVDPRGCWVLEGVQFGSNSAEFGAGSVAAVDAVSVVLAQNPGLRVRIEGHTDSTGSEVYNQQLSERRAEAVKAALVEAGIEPARLDVAGLGEAEPAADNATPEGRAANRRIEFTVER